MIIFFNLLARNLHYSQRGCDFMLTLFLFYHDVIYFGLLADWKLINTVAVWNLSPWDSLKCTTIVFCRFFIPALMVRSLSVIHSLLLQRIEALLFAVSVLRWGYAIKKRNWGICGTSKAFGSACTWWFQLHLHVFSEKQFVWITTSHVLFYNLTAFSRITHAVVLSESRFLH